MKLYERIWGKVFGFLIQSACKWGKKWREKKKVLQLSDTFYGFLNSSYPVSGLSPTPQAEKSTRSSSHQNPHGPFLFPPVHLPEQLMCLNSISSHRSDKALCAFLPCHAPPNSHFPYIRLACEMAFITIQFCLHCWDAPMPVLRLVLRYMCPETC